MVPVGLMPQATSDGWWLKICPDGMPHSVMMALSGHEHHHHEAETETYQPCDLGGVLFDHPAAVVFDLELAAESLSFRPNAVEYPRCVGVPCYHSRAPPKLSLT